MKQSSPAPDSPEVSEAAFETLSELRVRYAETDQMGVVYHANYLVWCEIGRTDFIRALGTPYARLEQDGVRLAVSDATMRFHASARYDDPIRVYTRVADVKSRALRFDYRIVHAETDIVLVTASTTLVSIDNNGRLARLPDTLRDTLDRTMPSARSRAAASPTRASAESTTGGVANEA